MFETPSLEGGFNVLRGNGSKAGLSIDDHIIPATEMDCLSVS